MREDNTSETRAKTSKFADQNRIPKGHQNQTMKGNKNSSKLRSASTWGSQIVRGFSGDKKSMKKPLMESDIMNQNNSLVPSHSRVKRSLITDLSCSTNSNQVHPKTIQFQTHKRQSSRDLFVELDQLRNLLQESKNREFKLQAELSECKRNPRVLELERELVEKKTKIEGLLKKVELLEEEKTILSDQFLTKNEDPMPTQNLEVEVVELRRLNKDLQLQKRNIALRLSSVQSQLSSLAMASESDTVAKIKAEASMLRYTNEDLSKQVEDLQMSRLNEVEELAYLRWVNSCLRNELRSSCSTINATEKLSSNSSTEKRGESADSCLSSFKNECLDYDGAKSPNSVNKLSKWSLPDEDLHDLEGSDDVSVDTDQMSCPRRRHSMSGSKCSAEGILPYKRRQSDGFIITKEMHNKEEFLPSNTSQLHMKSLETNNKLPSYFDVEKRALRIPNPPPKPSCIISCGNKEERYTQIHPPPLPPPPPPPPPIQKLSERSNIGAVQRAPQVVEFYHSLMKRDSRKDSSNGGICDASDVAGVRSSMIGEIENRSSHLLAIKADIETQGEFVNSLIREVNNAAYQNIEDVVAFVQWLDDELCFLVDERAVLKHFDWPERKADTLREAAFGYRDLKLLESEVSSFKDDLRLPYDIALKKMVALFEKMERIVYNLFRTRELLMRNCKEFHIPTEWMLDNGAINKIRIGSVKLAKLYMKRVAMELQSKVSFEKDHALDYVLLQGVRFAFRIHQFAGGFDAETMHAFEELRMLANVLNNK